MDNFYKTIFSIALFCIVAFSAIAVYKNIQEINKTNVKVSHLWVTNSDLAEFEPHLVLVKSKSDNIIGYYSIEQNEESQGFFNLYYNVIKGNETISSKLLGSSKSVEELQLFTESFRQ